MAAPDNTFFLVCVGGLKNRPRAFAKISPQDAELVLRYKWSLTRGVGSEYYVRAIDRTVKPPKQVKLHRLLLSAPPDKEVDHINGDPLDNRRENLRFATRAQQMRNRQSRCGQSVYKGVSWHEKAKRWRATITIDRKQKHLGYYEKQEDAATAYNKCAVEVWGEFARPNPL